MAVAGCRVKWAYPVTILYMNGKSLNHEMQIACGVPGHTLDAWNETESMDKVTSVNIRGIDSSTNRSAIESSTHSSSDQAIYMVQE